MTLTLFFGFPVLLFIYLLRCSLPSSSNMKVIAFSRLSEFTTVEIPCMLVQWLHALMKTQNQRRLSWHFHTCNHTVQSWLSGLIKSDILSGCLTHSTLLGSLVVSKREKHNTGQMICKIYARCSFPNSWREKECQLLDVTQVNSCLCNSINI